MTTPLESLKASETNLIRQINGIAGAVANTATNSVESALATLFGEVAACRERLRSAAEEVSRQIQDLAAFCQGIVALDVTGIAALEQAEDDRIARLTREEVSKELAHHSIDISMAQQKVMEALERQKVNGEHTAAVEASGSGQPTLPRPEVQAAFQAVEERQEEGMSAADLDAAFAELRRRKGFAPMTPEEAEKAWEEASEVPISKDRIKEIVEFATNPDTEAPNLVDEEPVPPTSDGSPYYDHHGDKEVPLGVGTGVPATPLPDVPQPGKNGRSRKAKKGK